MTASYGPRLLPTMLIMKDVPIRMCRHFWGRLAGTEQKRAPRMPLDPVTKSARSLRRVLLGLDDVPMDDKIGPVADALLGDTDKGEAKKTPGSHGNSHRCSASAL